jgi:hypothetical protein
MGRRKKMPKGKAWISEKLEEQAEEIFNQKVRKAVREYIERMILLIKTHRGASRDAYIDCPQCGNIRSLDPSNGWRCLWRDCNYVLPPEFIPPTEGELERCYHELMRNKKLAFMRSLFPEGEFDKLFE